MRNYEFRDLNRKLEEERRLKIKTPKTYLDYLKQSDISPELKRFYSRYYAINKNVLN